MNYPKELKYRESHEWVKFLDESTALIGISDYAQDSLGGIVFANLPEIGDDVSLDESFADLESVKVVSDIYSPVTGRVLEINERILDAPELINEDPYGAWLIKVENITEKGELMDAEAYEDFVANLAE